MSEKPDKPDLWPDGVFSQDVRTPLQVLREQAAVLSQKTSQVLQGRVETNPLPPAARAWPELSGFLKDDSGLLHRFVIRVPALGDYRYELLWVAHDVGLYPCVLSGPAFEGSSVRADDEAQFTELLQVGLSSAQTKRVIAALLAQSRRSENAA